MACDYYVLVVDDDRDRVVGLFAVNRDAEAGRLDTVFYDYWARTWVFDPGAVTRFLFSLDYAELRQRVSRIDAEQAAVSSASRCRPRRS